ncbi:hypothetical protein [Bradyrhizobium sp. 169]|nr:hypothetical protein [Bradyrhizobium sp. 169]
MAKIQERMREGRQSRINSALITLLDVQYDPDLPCRQPGVSTTR